MTKTFSFVGNLGGCVDVHLKLDTNYTLGRVASGQERLLVMEWLRWVIFPKTRQIKANARGNATSKTNFIKGTRSEFKVG